MFHLLTSHLPHVTAWAPPAVGVCTAGLLFLGTRFLNARPRQQPVKDAEARLVTDPFAICFAERRTALRRDGEPVAVRLATEKGEETSALVVNRSLGGLCLTSTRECKTGEVLTVHRLDRPHTVPGVRVFVRHCKKQGKAWQIGGPFVGAPAMTGMLFA